MDSSEAVNHVILLRTQIYPAEVQGALKVGNDPERIWCGRPLRAAASAKDGRVRKVGFRLRVVRPLVAGFWLAADLRLTRPGNLTAKVHGVGFLFSLSINNTMPAFHPTSVREVSPSRPADRKDPDETQAHDLLDDRRVKATRPLIP